MLRFEGAGKIVRELCTYIEDMESFIYTSENEYPEDTLQFPYRTYFGSMTILQNIKISYDMNLSISNP